MKTRCIAFVHHKGGTGKTTSCINIAGYLAKGGKKVLVVDMDPQGNSTAGLGIDKNSVQQSMYHAMLDNPNIGMRDIILQTGVNNIHLAPATYDLAYVQFYTKDVKLLQKVLKDVKDYYDYILIDTPPSLGRFMISGIIAADHVIVTMDPGIFALEGIDALKVVFDEVKEQTDKDVDVAMVLLTKARQLSLIDRIRKRSDRVKEITKDLKDFCENVFVVPYDDNTYNAQLLGIPMSHYKPSSKAGSAYKKIVEEVMKYG